MSALRRRRPLALARSLCLATMAIAALCAPRSAEASNPSFDGARNLAMGGATRSSSAGADALLVNPAGMTYYPQFFIEPGYQISIRDRTHGIGVFIGDSLNNPRFAIGLGYVFTRGAPEVRYRLNGGDERSLELSHFGHDASLAIGIVAIKNWLHLGVTPKFQYMSLRYLDDDDVARDAADKLKAFGFDASAALSILGFARVSVVGGNLAGPSDPFWTEDESLDLENVDAAMAGAELDLENVRRISDYPRTVAHGLAIFPLGKPNFSLNFDGMYDFTSYHNQDKRTRTVLSAGGEFIFKYFPFRVGGYWDNRGRGSEDDRGYVTGGLGFMKPPSVGGVGVNIGASFSQQVTGTNELDTVIGVTLGLQMNPDF